MKQQDIAIIIVIAAIAGLLSFFVSGFLFSSGGKKQQTVAKIDQISAEFTEPNKKYFSKDAINPTQLIQIGDTSNQNPFSGSN